MAVLRVHRITVSGYEMELLIESLETRRQNVLDECLNPDVGKDDLVEGMEQIRQLDGLIKKYTKMVWQEAPSGDSSSS